MKTWKLHSALSPPLALVLTALALPTVVFPTTASAQSRSDRPPEDGGEVFQLGMPPIWKAHAGGTVGWYTPGEPTGSPGTRRPRAPARRGRGPRPVNFS